MIQATTVFISFLLTIVGLITPNHSQNKVLPSITNRPTQAVPLNKKGNVNNIFSTLTYPGSQIINNKTNSLNLESSDDPSKITNWYKNQINNMHGSIQTAVITKSNDLVDNILIGEEGDQRLTIKISKDTANSSTDISIFLNK